MMTGKYRSVNDLAEDDGRRWFPRFSDEVRGIRGNFLSVFIAKFALTQHNWPLFAELPQESQGG